MINYYNQDNLDYMRSVPDRYYDFAIADPPYGLKMDSGKCYSGNGIYGKKYRKGDWDKIPPAPDYFQELKRISKQQIIWGVNYFSFPLPGGRIIWDKCNSGSDQSDCEIAFNSCSQKVNLFRFLWRGMLQGKSIKEGHVQQGNKKLNDPKIHPTQKPVKLYEWLLKEFVPKGSKIIDPNLGSGSIGIAALNMPQYKYELDGIELDRGFYEDACRWKDEKITIIDKMPTFPF